MSGHGAERRLAAIMFTDIVGYTALMAESEERGLGAQERHWEVVRPLVERYHGDWIEGTGDESLSTFQSALDAVNCALAIQHDLREDPELKLRIGIHSADVTFEGGRVYGDGVNVASRIRPLAEPGGVCVSGEIYKSVRNQPNILASPLGDQELKNVPGPMTAFALSGTPRPPAGSTPSHAPVMAGRSTAGGPTVRPEDLARAGVRGQRDVAVLVVPAIWVLYVAIVFEILFMISPLAIYYYSAYGPSLNLLHGSPWTAWLTDFFLPHFSQTSSPVLNSIQYLGGALVLSGATLFLVAFVQVYRAKFQHRGAVVGGLYAVARHPQYVAAGILGLGTLLMWPRLLVLITYITMLFLYWFLARSEEQRCIQEFGEGYRAYRERTGMFFPRLLKKRLPVWPALGARRVPVVLALYVAAMTASVSLSYGLRDYSLSRVSSLYTENMAVLSPAILTDAELRQALRVALTGPEVRERLQAVGQTANLLVYVVPLDWELADLPIPLPEERHGGHYMPSDFDRGRYKVLFTEVRAHQRALKGAEIVKKAYGRDPILLVKVNTEAGRIIQIETPPAHVVWGDISTPLF